MMLLRLIDFTRFPNPQRTMPDPSGMSYDTRSCHRAYSLTYAPIAVMDLDQTILNYVTQVKCHAWGRSGSTNIVSKVVEPDPSKAFLRMLGMVQLLLWLIPLVISNVYLILVGVGSEKTREISLVRTITFRWFQLVRTCALKLQRRKTNLSSPQMI